MKTNTSTVALKALTFRQKQSIAIAVVSVLLMSLGTIAPQIDFSASNITAGLAVLILLFGVPHGGLDLDLASRRWPLSTNIQKLLFCCAYLAIVAVAIGFWFALPILGLVSFMVLSVWHFGADWTDYVRVAHSRVTAVWVLTIPALLHPQEFLSILEVLMIRGDIAQMYVTVSAFVGLTSSIFLLMVFAKHFQIHFVLEVFSLAMILLYSNILVFFTAYFCLIHSARYLHRYTKHINRDTRAVSQQSSMMLLATIVLGAGLYYATGQIGVSVSIYAWIFIGLFALTVPHMVLVERLFKSESSDD
ncbi:MAG: Brp/Blh family beta-carotene 15,15'-dioxygenase [Glaciecola sp.]|jgi:Brp/Blh family beta-carotene 15,15'-monooxygenase